MIITFSRKILTLSEWSTTWLMDINICKCAILPITKNRNTSFFNHTIFCNTIEHVDDHEYLWVSILQDLHWEEHEITKNKALGLLRCTLSPCSREVKIRTYQAIVRTQKLGPHTTFLLLIVLSTSTCICSFCSPRLSTYNVHS